jgi:hypothetical protein
VIQAPDHQRVSRACRFERRRQSWPVGPRTGQPVVVEALWINAGRDQGITLEIEPLIVRTDPCVADQQGADSTREAAASTLFIAPLPIHHRAIEGGNGRELQVESGIHGRWVVLSYQRGTLVIIEFGIAIQTGAQCDIGSIE